ncbi:ribosomal L29e protein family-domain-containing protein [Dimargaris cristalligena]|uniref:60S ribosomal protein L29 n=1 Tax=Dimargaris cristalligena TaxID=215637 RepID=A0A4P9ZQ70_9FUNG|nr:ribosomal L29e protein family-domain-containing protein [Dimargaris cristalligena]|eukprot:RKP35477.1 ribosomal L29e protein family-domain-containing protein [Dimargaris cristalligena]
MAKSKNHTNHNQNRKAHRNGIKRAASKPKIAQFGVCQKFRRNMRYAAKKQQELNLEAKKAKVVAA